MKRYLKYLLLLIPLLGILYVTIPIKQKRTFDIPQQYQFINYTKWSELDTLSYLAISKVLKVDSINLVFTYKNYSSHEAALIYYPEQNLYYCYFNKDLSRTDLFNLLYHELIHLKQYSSKELYQRGDTMVYLSIPYTSLSYNYRPWEVEAYKYQDILKYQVNKLYYEKKNRFKR